MSAKSFREKLLSGEPIASTFLRTPAYQTVEILAQSELDCVCIDAEHAPFDRAAMDSCIAIARALSFPVLVRLADASAREVLQALDCGADGIIAPHIDSVEKAQDLARSARFGLNGRGFAGSSRWAGFTTRPMEEIVAETAETIVIAQIEEPSAVDAAAEIASVEGIDGLFLGPADLSVGYGHDNLNAPELDAAFDKVGAACAAAEVAFMTFVGDSEQAAARAKHGVTGFVMASDHIWLRNGATTEARRIKDFMS